MVKGGKVGATIQSWRRIDANLLIIPLLNMPAGESHMVRKLASIAYYTS